MEPFIRSVGGYYKVLQRGVKTNFSPLKQKGTPRNIATTKNIMRVCAEITNNGPLDKDMGWNSIRLWMLSWANTL